MTKSLWLPAFSPLPGVVEVTADANRKTASVRVDASKFDSQAALEKLAEADFESALAP